jgi:RNA 2',3'-cyclic 3'-phosphodiesterase
VRLFIAAELPLLHRSWLETIIGKLKTSPNISRLRWQTPEQWHVTLKFLGDCPDHQLGAIEAVLKEGARDISAFRLSLDQLGTFRGPRGGVLFVDVAQGRDELALLANHFQETMVPLGFKKETRPFRAHVTLARSRDKKLLPLKNNAPTSGCPDAFVDRVALYQSHLSSTGSRYEKKAEALLGF